ncbi:hypothetical protein NDU88_002665 [Pleurodeles waltl]|uniref:Uncharacterized protein n=1 Tax=Pleurodeles waltl TaxID=8319 RepID=A0AAV7VD85_PLEWA|nr:hypothetical protein NDU88_002665 [Pleurodeles waltl]
MWGRRDPEGRGGGSSGTRDKNGAHRRQPRSAQRSYGSPRVALNARGGAPLPDRRRSGPGERSKGLKVSQGEQGEPYHCCCWGTGPDSPELARLQ